MARYDWVHILSIITMALVTAMICAVAFTL
jgi:hypothetical protein